jgi:hypothetical protein
MFDTGYWTVGRVRGVKVRVHWSAPIGAFFFTGFSMNPLLWAGFLFLVVVHELGHAAIVRRFGYHVTGVRIHGFGGDCPWEGDATFAEVCTVAWGGVLAEGVLGIATLIALLAFGTPSSPILAALAFTFTWTNVRMILFNLLPIPGFDGYHAWQLLPILWQGRKERLAYQRDRVARRKAEDATRAREKARAKVNQDMRAVDVSDEDLAPMPPEVKAVLDRIVRGEATKKARED